MIKTAAVIEAEHRDRFHAQIQEQKRLKYTDPSYDEVLDQRVWVVHVWRDGAWQFAGFRPMRRLRRKQTMNRFFTKIRRRLGLEKLEEVMIMDFHFAAKRAKDKDQSWRTRPPQFQQAKPKMEQVMPEPLVAKQPKRRSKVKAYKLNKQTTRYVALGRLMKDRYPGWLYLGPLSAETKRDARQEAVRLFTIYSEILIIATSEMSKSLRNAMHSGKRVQAGVSRVQWPEVPPTFEEIWVKAAKKLELTEAHEQVAFLIWLAEKKPWLSVSWIRKQFRKLDKLMNPRQEKKSWSRKRKASASPKKSSKRLARNRAAMAKLQKYLATNAKRRKASRLKSRSKARPQSRGGKPTVRPSSRKGGKPRRSRRPIRSPR
jgi:hypothetical protein